MESERWNHFDIQYTMNQTNGTFLPPTRETGFNYQIMGFPLCPDLLRHDLLGEADNFRGKVVRAFFWLMRLWPV